MNFNFGYTQVYFGTILPTVFISPKNILMRSLLYIIAVILVIGWAIGVFAYSATGLIHALLVLAIIAVVISLLRPTTTV